MVTKKFNVRTGVKTGNIILDAATDSINAASIFATTKLTAAEINVALVSSNIIPKTDSTYDLGNATHQFNNLFMTGNIQLATFQIKPTSTGIAISGELTASTANIDTFVANSITANSLNVDIATVNTQLVINSTTDATSTDTGSIITAGGVGIMKDLYVGGAIHLANGLGGTTSKGSIKYNDGDSSIDFNFNG